MARRRYNGLSAALGASLTDVATTATLAAALTHSDGTAVPTISGDDYLPLTLLNPDGGLAEIIYVTAYTSGSTTITTMTRGEEGTTAQTHANGALIRHAPTALDIVGNVLIEDGGTYPTRADDTIPALFIGPTDPGPDGLDVSLDGDSWANTSGTDDLAAHLADAIGAHAATAISFTPAGTIAATTVQAAIEEAVTEAAAALAAHLADTTDAHDASAISFAPVGTIAATDVQAAIAEVAAEAAAGAGAVSADTIWDAKGDLAVGTAANTAQRLPVGSNGQVLTADSAETVGAKWATPSGSSPWATLINLPMTSLTDWTASGGTWDLTGAGSTMRDSAALAAALHMNIYGPPRVPIDHMVIECEIMINSSNNTAASRAGFIFGEASNSGQVSLFAGVSGFTSAVDFEASGITNYGQTALAANIAHGTWIKLRVHKSGSSFSAYVNDVLVSAADMTTMAASRRHRFSLMTYAANASFRNLKVYVPATPA